VLVLYRVMFAVLLNRVNFVRLSRISALIANCSDCSDTDSCHDYKLCGWTVVKSVHYGRNIEAYELEGRCVKCTISYPIVLCRYTKCRLVNSVLFKHYYKSLTPDMRLKLLIAKQH